MPRKSAGPAADTNGDVSMVSEAPSTSSPKQTKEPKEKSSRKSGGQQGTDAITIDVSEPPIPSYQHVLVSFFAIERIQRHSRNYTI